MGSFTAVTYGGSFPGEADGIILTGYLNDMNWPFATSLLQASIVPVMLDQKFAGQSGYEEYFTTLEGKRGDAFYYLPNADPRVIAVDENLKDTMSLGDINTGLQVVCDPISFQIEGPVQIVIGQYDYLFCGGQVNCSGKTAVQNYEASWYGPSACVETAVIKDSGHNLNLQFNADAAYNYMLSWADLHVGRTAGAPPQHCGGN